MIHQFAGPAHALANPELFNVFSNVAFLWSAVPASFCFSETVCPHDRIPLLDRSVSPGTYLVLFAAVAMTAWAGLLSFFRARQTRG